MDWLILALVGVIQGVTEWIPVSSQGINSLVLSLLGVSPELILPSTIWLHLGTLAAAMTYFRRDLNKLVRSLASASRFDEDFKLLIFITIATLMTCIIGFPLYQVVKGLSSMSGASIMAIIGACMILSGLIQKLATKARGFKGINVRDSILIGSIQSLSVIPGLSRSGLTIAALLLLGYDSKMALRISFIMSIPIIILANAYLALTGEISYFAAQSVIGLVLALVIGYITISALMRLAVKLKFWSFCLIVGFLSFIPLITELLMFFWLWPP
ncbi:MAG: undecaprenyl-diphosphate phosphatase [Candidatus Nezhaarchaeota archaeon]|nr:undecaprenyl-diphosphate phosphatase [Candidatus Nezhaarchaeota archaeon]MCX8141238.1 undecaprenyl-diphosphate phosphatase [Candidatus Nezhaarchaeota archaeon]MDW8049504.1 undecaprenyl-diphosphate phosphatase [Nitrososphaerota archaeon]